MTFYKNKYRVESARLHGWDYTNDGIYFITICTKNKQPFFGRVVDGEMVLNGLGEIAKKYWLEIPNHFKNVDINEFIVMPDHIHGIIGIKYKNTTRRDEALPRLPSQTTTNIVSHNHNIKRKPKQKRIDIHATRDEAVPRLYRRRMSNISPKQGSLSVIIGSFKSIVTKTIRTKHPNIHFAWQPRFHDHIIQTENAYYLIYNYIKQNPAKWQDN